MKCKGCFKELKEGKKPYAMVVGSVEHFDGDYENAGFYPDETESWIAALCEKCGMAVHKFIADKVQAKHL